MGDLKGLAVKPLRPEVSRLGRCQWRNCQSKVELTVLFETCPQGRRMGSATFHNSSIFSFFFLLSFSF